MTGLGIVASLGLALHGVTMTAATTTTYADLAGRYALVEMNGDPFTARAVIELDASGAVHGEGPCNTFGFTQSVAFPAFRPGAIRATRRACPELAAENAFLQALQHMTTAAFDGQTLTLTDEEGHSLAFRSAD